MKIFITEIMCERLVSNHLTDGIRIETNENSYRIYQDKYSKRLMIMKIPTRGHCKLEITPEAANHIGIE